MGCGVSQETKKTGPTLRREERTIEEKEMKLSSCKLTFSQVQLGRLNAKYQRLLDCDVAPEPGRLRQLMSLSVVVERLVQRLVCSVGCLDHRFNSKFLVDLNPQRDKSDNPKRHLRFKYLVRLDALSTPAIHPDLQPAVRVLEGVPEGSVRLRLHGELLEEWAEFIAQNGCLRRDKVQERFVELLARAAARPCEPFSPLQVDEARLCGAPGKVVDPITLHHILAMTPESQFFYGSAEANESRFPDPRDFRIVIVEGECDTRLHVAFLSTAAQSLSSEDDIEITLVVGVGVNSWPQCADYPFRLPLDHLDILLAYQSAQMGYFLVPRGPHHTLRCEERSSAWEIRSYATELVLEQHYAPGSVVSRVHRALELLLVTLRARGVKTVNRYIMKSLLFVELEKKRTMQQWTAKNLSRRVLSVLDRLLTSLRCQTLRHYLFRGQDLLMQETTMDEDLVSDGDILEHYLRQVCCEGGRGEAPEESVPDLLESVMLLKWKQVILNLSPPVSTRSTRLGVSQASSASVCYTNKQMQYVAAVFREMLKMKRCQVQQVVQGDSNVRAEDGRSDLEDLLYLLQVMFDQAKQKMQTERRGSRESGSKELRRGSSRLSHVLDRYDVSTAMLLDGLKREGGVCWFTSDMMLVAKVLECLYQAVDSDDRVLAPILRPFLNQLFKGSHENCWFLQEWFKRTDVSEMDAIGAFSRLAVGGGMNPLEGILDSVQKGWNWARNCLDTLQAIADEHSAGVIIGDKLGSDPGLRLIWTPTPDSTLRHTVPPLHSPLDRLECRLGPPMPGTPASTLRSVRSGAWDRNGTVRSVPGSLYQAVNAEATLQGFTGARDLDGVRRLRSWSDQTPAHAMLRDSSPLTLTSVSSRRQGTHRGLGSVVLALIALQKLTVLQEVSQYLPNEERVRVLNDIKKLSKEVQRLSVSNCRRRRSLPGEGGRSRFSFKRTPKSKKSRSATLPNRPRGGREGGGEVYRAVEEGGGGRGAREVEAELMRREAELEVELRRSDADSLLGTCRMLRRRTRPTVADARATYTPFRAGKFGNTGRGRVVSHTATLPNLPHLPSAAINAPFYIRVSSFQNANSNKQMTEI